MKTDTEIRVHGMKVLVDGMGEIGAEKFISLILREPFNYTEWQRTLWAGESVREISTKAARKAKPAPKRR